MFGPPKPSEFQTVEQIGKQLQLVPIRNTRAREVHAVPDTLLVLEVDLSYRGLQKRIATFLKASQVRRVQLDGLALEIYQAIAPDVTVEHIIDGLMERHSLSFFEARGLAIWYLSMLAERGVVAIGLPEEASATPAAADS